MFITGFGFPLSSLINLGTSLQLRDDFCMGNVANCPGINLFWGVRTPLQSPPQKIIASFLH
ncbi:hypothetical protein E2C01_077490 [Portunus trituberculatus]|uniref:Uncharacterized protein n=1 Tax=Portunus trituberculatus TaxID=210409 RepID=A0A5B7IMF7_PORTR|nr:hypothetical protein [Portunus trituberculatus]